jgi:mRNA (2'-O-methyladenosine-N6-)-methyltransferase
MSNQEIRGLPVDKLSKRGFCFLWIIANQINSACEMMNHWGYEVVDQIIWVKLKDSKQIYLSHGYYFMHSYEICLVGYKCPVGETLEYNSKVSNNLIFANVRRKSQKPDELYEIIDLMMPGARKVELFARNNNLRTGWFSLGNQLGEQYDTWLNNIECNECKEALVAGRKRFKSKTKVNYDVCEKCLKEKGHNRADFYEFANEVNEDILHNYHKCNKCGVEPIWGPRFECTVCENYDLCEACVDANIEAETKFHDMRHELKIIEVPLVAHGLPAHDAKYFALRGEA